MNYPVASILSQNITLLYDRLDLPSVNIDELKQLPGAETQPMVMATPEMVVVMYPSEHVVIQIGDRRVRLTLPEPNAELGSAPLPEFAQQCNRLVRKASSNLVAYGFNYDVLVGMGDSNANELSIEIFIADRNKVESAIQGKLMSFAPRFRFQREQKRYDLVLEPVDEHHIQAHFNSHSEFANIGLPSAGRLRKSFHEEFSFLSSILKSIFGGYAC
ncbi:MAG: hypothetical protein GX597_17520 [Anaerolineaceae bacterium]|nr:hypothetical protein [Anaerolineaceae bacterium]